MTLPGLLEAAALLAACGADGPAPTIPAVTKPVDLKSFRAPVETIAAPETLAIDLNFSESAFPKASVLSVTKPVVRQESTVGKASVSDAKTEAPTPPKAAESPVALAPAPVVENSAKVHQVPAAKLPPEVELVAKHHALATAVHMLAVSPIESDRMQALATIAKTPDWQRYRPTYQSLRQVALAEYNTKMRLTAVELLGQARDEHALVADTLRLSAQFDGDAGVRSKAYATIERLAAAPPDRFAR